MQSGYPLSVTSAVNTTRSQGGGQPPNSTGKSAKLRDRWGTVWAAISTSRSSSTRRRSGSATFHARCPNVLGPGIQSWDIPVLKTTRIGEHVRFQLRDETFNIWNHPAFANPVTSFGTASFGRVNDIANRANPARQIQLGAKLLWQESRI